MKALVFFGLVGIVAFAAYDIRRSKEINRRGAEQRQRGDAIGRAILSGVVDGLANQSPASPQRSSSAQPSSWNVPDGYSLSPGAVTIGPNGEKYYHYERVSQP